MALTAAVAGTALAATGDPVEIDRPVEVRVAPRSDAPVLKRLPNGLAAIERARLDGWIEIEIPSAFLRGWVRSVPPGRQAETTPVADAPSILPAEPKPVEAVRSGGPSLGAAFDEDAGGPPAQAADAGAGWGSGRLAAVLEPPPVAEAPRPTSPRASPVSRFRASLRYLVSELPAAARDEALSDVEAGGPGLVLITAGQAWSKLPAATRERVLDRLFDRWLAASASSEELRLEVRDREGRLVNSRSGP